MGKESKDRKRSRSRERTRKRSRSRTPKRDRKRSRSRDKEEKRRKKSKSPRRSRSRTPRGRRRSRSRDRRRDDKDRRDRDVDYDRKKEDEKAAAEDEKRKNAEKEKEQRELEKKIEERRAKVAEWRERQRRLKLESGVVEAAPEKEETKKEEEDITASTAKPWSLEDEDDDDEPVPTSAAETAENGKEEKKVEAKPEEKMEVKEEEEEDPLDAFMSQVAQTMKKNRPSAAAARIVTINSAPTEEKNKGEILENEGRAEVVIDDIDLESAAQSLCHKARLLNAANHEMIYYRPFTKDFYVETPEIRNMTKAEVRALREELDDIKVKGKKCPRPIKTWAQCGCSRVVLNQLKKLNYAKPTPIQSQAIPAVMAGRDVIGIAQTGSGKTLAFLLPMFRHIMDQDPLEEMDGPIALIMAPTRELCMQTWKEANKFARVLNLRVVCAYGGVGISEQIADLKRGAEVIVATPGRFIDLLVSNNGKVTNLRRVTYLVLDEADRMFDMGFEPQVMKIIDNIREDRQTVLFSATFPRQMEALAQKVLKEPIEILVGGKSVVCQDVTQNVVICEEHQKALKLLELLGIYYEMGNTIVFVDRQEKADEICGMLLASHYACAPLHGGIDQADRDSNIIDFKNGSVKILVATSVAARGLDVKNLLLVVNYDCPNHYEDYVHRCGRTGRAGNKGYAYTFILTEHQERMAGEVCKAFESAGVKPPPELKAMFERFVAEMEAQGKKVHLGGKGFSGSGYKHNDEEAESDANKKMMSRLILNIEHGQADDDELEEQLTSMLKTTKRIMPGQQQQKGRMSEKVQDKLAAAKARAAELEKDVLKTPAPAPETNATSAAAAAVMRGTAITPLEVTAEMRARQAANKLNEKLNYMGGEAPKINMGDDWEYYEEEMDINDFPQQVRYKICSRESVGHIAEFADVGLSVRGTHYPSGREPKNNDRRLHLLIEARSEHNLRRAKEEIIRIMKDSLRQLSQGPRGGMQARYRVQ